MLSPGSKITFLVNTLCSSIVVPVPYEIVSETVDFNALKLSTIDVLITQEVNIAIALVP